MDFKDLIGRKVLGEASRDGKNLQHPADRVNGWFMAALPGAKSGSPKRHVPEKARDPKPYELPYALSATIGETLDNAATARS